MRFMVGENEIDTEFPSLEMISLNLLAVPLDEYMHLAFHVSKTCGIEMRFHEDDRKYRLDFYFYRSVMLGEPLAVWKKLIGGSDLVCMAVCPDRPKTVRVSLYRDKTSEG